MFCLFMKIGALLRKRPFMVERVDKLINLR